MAAPSLAGWTVGVTADRRASEQIELLERRGARVVHGPTIRTVALELGAGARDATEALIAHPPELVILTTGVGARAWFDAAESIGLGDQLLDVCRRATVIVRGPKAHGAATTAGLDVAWMAPNARGDEIVQYLATQEIAGRRIALQLDGRDVPMIAEALRSLGADVIAVPVYRWTLPEDPAPARRLVQAVCDERIDAISFTSAPALWNCLALADTFGCHPLFLAALREAVIPVSVGVVCTEAAHAAGIARVVEPDKARLGAMVLAIAAHAEATNRAGAIQLGAHHIVLRNAAIVVDGETFELSPREQAVASALLTSPGRVVSKESLLRDAWPEGGADLHAVEVAVGRLRRKVKPHLQIRAVARRGYLLSET